MSKTAAKDGQAGTRGLTIERRFTSPEVRPFDEVEWELRDAVIGDPEKPAFAQRDVEFPKSWSQNATNIVAQKYFRGQLGSPQRERSVKQMIGRVAGRITEAGREGGYFTTEEDAATFEDELTHILLHQKAAFNSPVWFNIGWRKPGQEQASACFILSVEDNMESILDWNTREGIIFKGGSGSGINLSKIRGSMEPLSKGGAASGPVSFMRGADSWAGAIKCLAEGTEIMTESGLKPIEDVREGDQVLTRFGPRPVLAAHANGTKPLVKVTTELGNDIVCTAEHRFLVRERGGETVWREAGEIQPDDYLTLDLGQVEYGELQRLKPVDRGHHNERQLVLPQVLHERFARWLGWLFGDGNITQRPFAHYIGMQIASEDPDLVDGYADLVKGIFGSSAHIYANERSDKQDASVSLRFASTQAIRFLEANGLAKQRAADLRVPDKIKASQPDVRAAFLSGLFEADGGISSKRYPTLSTISHGFAIDVHRLLLSIGIPSKVRREDNRVNAYGDRPIYTVRLVSLAGIARFEQFVGFISGRKRKALAEVVKRRIESPYETDWALPHAEAELDQLWRAGDQRLRKTLAPYCRYEQPRALSGLRATALLNKHSELVDTVVEEAASPYAYYTTATVEPAGVGPVFDITVEDTHEYLVHNIITHNSGGGTRRAAKMVVLDVDHPDVEDFIWCKAREEEKAAALRDAGFDMRLDSETFASVQYQNANNSVRVTDEFMQAVANGDQWELTARTTGEAIKTVDARELMRQIADAAWRCADPGLQYDSVINRWHTSPESGRINASNPCCFVGETLVQTTSGAISFDELHRRSASGEELPFTHSFARGAAQMGQISRVWVAGMTDELVEVATDDGGTVRCTPEHRFLTASGDYVEARSLMAGTKLRAVVQAPVPALPVGPSAPTPDVTSRTAQREVTEVQELKLDAPVPVFDLEVPGFHNFVVATGDGDVYGVVVHNSEYMHVDDSACNLASLNLMKFRNADGTFDVADFEHAVDIVFLAQEIIVGFSSYPTEKIGRNARAFRQLGLGYANLGALLMADGLAYDSDQGRSVAAAITALMTGRAYRHSAEIAVAMGPYDEYVKNREPHNKVMRMHRDAAYEIDDDFVEQDLLDAGRRTWDEAVELGERNGFRNAQATVLAPTGTISFLMDCDTTGIEPDFSLVKFKELVGGGQMTIVNRTIPMALGTLGYTDQQIEQIEAYVSQQGTIIGAPELRDEHLPVFDVAVGERAISPMGHIKMMAAVQPFVSGAQSKTVNLPESTTVEDIADAYKQGWKLGLKALAIYRDGSKTAQALRTDAGDSKDEPAEVAAAAAEPTSGEPVRRKMPRERESITHKFSIGQHEGYITAGKYDDGSVGEIFLTDIGKEGSTMRGMMNAFATAISIGLQYGVPLETFVKKFSYVRFEPEGMTRNPEIPFAKSMPDYIMRWLASRFIADPELLEDLGIMTAEVRARREAQQALFDGNDEGNGGGNGGSESKGSNWAQEAAAKPANGGESPSASSDPIPATQAMTDTPPVVPARMAGADLGPACAECGGMMQRTGSCYTCTSCGNNTGCG